MLTNAGRRPELWGGVECSIVRVGDGYRSEFDETGHAQSAADLDHIAALGLRVLRYPVAWETVSPAHPGECDWTFSDARLARIRELGMKPIIGLLHHGSGPSYTSLIDEDFPTLFAAHAANVAERYPWADMFTPVNEPLTTARFSALYGHWYPHRQDMRSFLRCLVNQCLGTLLAMREVRRVTPTAQLVQTEDLGKIFSTPRLAYQAAHENQRRWLSLDLLCGRIDRTHPWHGIMLRNGIAASELELLASGEARPDIIGINYYATSERYLDEALHLYPPCFHGTNGKERYADVEAIRIDLPPDDLGIKARLTEAWERYALPLAITEVHHGSTREEQLRWLDEIWRSAADLAATGCDLRAVTAWSLFGAMDWNTLLTRRNGFYEPGAFDIRGPAPRRTALANAIAQIARTGTVSHPVLDRPGWWRRERRYYHPPATPAPAILKKPRAILIAGASGKLGRELIAACEMRGLDVVSPSRSEMDVTNLEQVAGSVAHHRPWAVINAAGADRSTGTRRHRIFGVNSTGAENMAKACARAGIPYMFFSTDRVFDGALERPYVEGDPTSPVCIVGGSKAEAERRVAGAHRPSLIIRASRLFGPEDRPERLLSTCPALFGAAPFLAATYAPDLVRTALDLLIDGEGGTWHLSSQGAVSLDEYAREHGLDGSPAPSLGRLIVLASERGRLMPSLRDAFARHRHAAAAATGAPFVVAAE